MNPNYFRAYGALVLLLGPAQVAGTFFRVQTQTQFLRWLFLLAAVEVVGFGLASLRKWAALYFSIPSLWFGIRLFVDSIHHVAFPFNLFPMLVGIALMLPLAITIRLWKELTWGRRFF